MESFHYGHTSSDGLRVGTVCEWTVANLVPNLNITDDIPNFSKMEDLKDWDVLARPIE